MKGLSGLVTEFDATSNLTVARDTDIAISATFTETKDGWSVRISKGGGARPCSRRKCLALTRLCELDAATKLSLGAGRAVRRTVPSKPDTSDGPHRSVEQILPLLLPIKVEDQLYPYQRQGVAWLLCHKKALLGDDMGLGKTVQALAAGRRLVRSGHVAWILIIAPRTLIANWRSESQMWAPELTVATALFRGKERADRWARIVGRAHLLITSYEQMREPPSALIKNSPDLVIADEAHRLRNIGSLATRGVRMLHSKRLWALTGTPIERDAEDLAVLLSLLDPSRFSHSDRTLPLQSLRAGLRPYFLRRTKESVLSELPTVTEHTELLDLTAAQRSAYRAAIASHAFGERDGGMLPLFNELRTICDVDPRTGRSSKLDRVSELISEIIAANEKGVVFSYILEPLEWLASRLRERGLESNFVEIKGSMSLEDRAAVLKSFRSDPDCHVLLASTRVASEGLTLIEANHVLFINRWWNPSSNAQARDRVVRIGQQRPVRIRSFLCRGTVEERLEQLLDEKTLTFEQLVGALSKPGSDDKGLDLIAT